MTTRSDDAPRLLLFGTPRLEALGKTVDLPETAPAHLVVYLAAQAQWIARESVAAYLWPELPDGRAQHNLRVALNRVGALLDPWQVRGALVAERRRVRFDISTDLGTFRAAMARGDWAAACTTIVAPLLETVRCAAYPALAEWMTVEREAVRRSWRKALIEANQLGDLSPGALGRYLAHYPADAEITTLAVTRLVSTGRAVEARDTLTAFRSAAGDELSPVDADAMSRQMERAAEGAALGAPWERGSVIGREEASAALSAAMSQGRLVTITGLPGVGKSSLARAWLHGQSGALADVPVAERTTEAALLERMATALTGRRSERMSRTDSLRALEGASGIVLVDGADQAPIEADLSELVATLYRIPGLHLLVTSRRPLGVEGERILPLGGLSTASPHGGPSPAAQLFLREVRRARFEVPARFEAAAEHIARASGGLPLALRLSAGWSRWMHVDDIVREFERSMRPEGGIDPSLRALLAATWQRLSAEQRAAIESLSVCPGSFDMPSAVELTGAPAAMVEALSSAGLIEPRERAGRVAWVLHTLVRVYAHERLHSAPAMHRRVCARFLQWLDRRVEREASAGGPPQVNVEAVAPLIDEIVQGWSLAIETGAVTAMHWLLAALVSWHEAKGEFELALRRLAPGIEALDDSVAAEAAMLTSLQVARATLTYRASDYEVAARLGLEAQALATRTGQGGLARRALNIVGLSRWMQMRLPEARAALQVGLASAVANDDQVGQRTFEGNLALLDKASGDYASAEERWRRALDLAIGQQAWNHAFTDLSNLANLLRHQRRFDECEPIALEALRLCRQHHLDASRPFALIGLAQLQASRGRHDAARDYLEVLTTCDPATLEGAVEAGAEQLRASMALEAGALDVADAHIARALQICQRHDDAANRAEALVLHASSLWARGEHAAAKALWLTIAKAPTTHASLRDEIAALLQTRESAPEGPTVDTTLVIERLLAR